MFFCDPCCAKKAGIRCQCSVWTNANVQDPMAEKYRKARIADSDQSMSGKVIELEKKWNTDAIEESHVAEDEKAMRRTETEHSSSDYQITRRSQFFMNDTSNPVKQ